MDTSSDHDSDSPSGITSHWVRQNNKIKGPRSRRRVITAINDPKAGTSWKLEKWPENWS